MAYTYHGHSELIKTGEVITVLPSGLIQKKVTVVGRKVGSGRGGNSSNRVGLVSQIEPLTASESQTQIGEGFFPFPTVSSGVDLNNGFVQYDIVGYKKGFGSVNSVINYKYRKLSSFIIEDQYTPQTVNISVEVGVRSTIVLSKGRQVETQNERGDTFFKTVYEAPGQYLGQLIAYNENGSVFTKLFKTERYLYTDPDIVVITNVVYEPSVVVESVSSTYYGEFTEYITTSSLKIERKVLDQTTAEE